MQEFVRRERVESNPNINFDLQLISKSKQVKRMLKNEVSNYYLDTR